MEWLTISKKGYKVIRDDNWYDWYDKWEIPKDPWNAQGDIEDFLRDSDLCIGEDKKFSRNNCPEPPDCSRLQHKKLGRGKLCINRVPFWDNQDVFFVGAMKCIPHWENCDKCMCGIITNDNYSTGTRCVYQNHPPDDDRTLIRGCDTKDFKWIGFSNNWFEVKDVVIDSSAPQTPDPTSSPTFSPTFSPTSSPTYTPTSASTEDTVSDPNTSIRITPSDDAFIYDKIPNGNFGEMKRLIVDGLNYFLESDLWDSLIKFDLKSIESLGNLKSAQLNLYCIDPNNNYGGRVDSTDSNWSEDTVTWNNAPARQMDESTLVGELSHGVQINNWYSLDLTDYFQKNSNNIAPILSLRISSPKRNRVAYASKQNSPEFVPYLSFEFQE